MSTTSRKHLDLSPIIQEFGQWAVTTYGVECLTQYYLIEARRIVGQDPEWAGSWENHLKMKRWVNITDARAALAFARRHFA